MKARLEKNNFDDELLGYTTECLAVQCKARSVQEPSENIPLFPKYFNQTPEDRNWNWKTQLAPSPTKWKSNSGYFGSYYKDGMYVALHIIYNSESFK